VTEDVKELKAGDGVSFELKMKIDLEETDADQIELSLRCGEGKKTICLFDLKKAEMSVNRNQADGWSRGVSRSVMYLKGKKELDVHILSDQSSLEIFTDQYQNNHSNNIFAGNAQNQLKIRALGGRAVIKDYQSYGLKNVYRGGFRNGKQ
jgi:beta-fructofuranosidase